MTLAKALGGGLPIGCMIVNEKYASFLKEGEHASTFGGGPVVCKSALAVLKTIQKEKLLSHTQRMGDYLISKLNNLKERFPQLIKEIRGMGLMVGVELNREGNIVVEKCLEKGLLINCTHEKVLRLMPALIVNKKEIDRAVGILSKVMSELR
jgi:acetylornithine/succinyldiaminopimelate/putrescine aminotransferase